MTALELAQQLINHLEETPEQDAKWIQGWHEEQTQALQAECAVLREALAVCKKIFEKDYYFGHPTARRGIQAIEEALASTPLSEKVAAVLRAADAWYGQYQQEPRYGEPLVTDITDIQLWKSVDALQKAEEGQSNG